VETVEDQLAKLFEGRYKLVLCWIYRKVQNREIAKDLVQEACVQLWERRATIKQVSRALLYRTVYFRWIDYHRTHRHNPIPYELLTEEVSPLTEPEELSIQRETICQATKAMTPDQKRLLVLKGDGPRNRTIAHLLGTTESAVKRRYARTIAQVIRGA